MSVFETTRDRPFCPNIRVVLGGTALRYRSTRGNLVLGHS
jgi:hypothetical protein